MKRIFAMGGGGFSMEPDNLALDEYVLSKCERSKPKVCFLPTASGDSPGYIDRFYKSFESLKCVPSHVSLFKPNFESLEQTILDKDIIYVGGGNTFNMLCLWRAWGLDVILKRALDQGTILTGISAGMICWFEQGVTDSKGSDLGVMDCLGFLKGAACPHFDGEANRRPRLVEMLNQDQIKPTLALDDGVGAFYVDDVLQETVSSRIDAMVYDITKTEGGDVAFEERIPKYLA